MKRKCRILLGIVTLFLTIVMTNICDIKADMVRGPITEEERKHDEEYERQLGPYIVNSIKGYTYLHEFPSKESDFTYVENGRRIVIYNIFIDDYGNQWGCGDIVYGLKERRGARSGSVLLSELKQVYDEEYFIEKHKVWFVYREQTFDLSDCDHTVPLWSFPLSGDCVYMIEPTEDANRFQTSYRYYYKDEFDQRWVKATYSKSMKEGWICISNPYDLDNYTHYASKIYEYPVSNPESIYHSKMELIVVVTLVVAVVGTTVVLIRRIYKKS